MTRHQELSIEGAKSADQNEAADVSSSSDTAKIVDSGMKAHVDEKRLLRKVDFHVLPILFIIYVVAFLDRVNISNALTMGLPAELGLVGQQPNIALTIFFVPYILFEIPSNVLMKKVNPHLWLSGSILCFGIIMLCQGFVRNYQGLLATRFFLGLTESGIFPGSFYLISFWYKPEESQKRFTSYWSSTIFAGAFGGLLATAIANMNGIRGLSNWRWVFILEGILTIIVGIIAFFSVTDFPREATWLSEDEMECMVARTRNAEAHTVPITSKEVLGFFSSIKNWLGAITYFSILVPLYSISFFLPTIVQSLGYSVVQTQLHSVPPFAAAFGFAVLLAYFSDRARMRAPFIFFGLALLIAGLAILLTIHKNFSTQYAALCLICMGALGIGGNIICWYIMNLRGHVERGIGSAWMISFGNIGGIIATFAFQKQDAPLFHSGYSICMAMTVLCTLSSLCYAICIWIERKNLRAKEKDTEHTLFI